MKWCLIKYRDSFTFGAIIITPPPCDVCCVVVPGERLFASRASEQQNAPRVQNVERLVEYEEAGLISLWLYKENKKLRD
jgi:hypothetical protein